MKVLDLFCGAGGLSWGFKRAGFKVTGVDSSEQAKQTFELNRIGDFRKRDLTFQTIEGNFDVLIGGPPCKPWSAVNTVKRGKSHRDYKLLEKFFEHVQRLHPKVFLLENVPPLASDPALQSWIGKLADPGGLGYSVGTRRVCYGDYGAATRRHRLVVFGSRVGSALEFFDKLEARKKKPSTVRHAIWHLKAIGKDELPDHVWPNLRTIDRYAKYYDSNKYGWYVLKWNESAPSFGNVTKTYILHPDSANGGKRVISVKEASLIMGFARGFRFPRDTSMVDRYQLVADSVSPKFSAAAALAVRDLLSGDPKQNGRNYEIDQFNAIR